MGDTTMGYVVTIVVIGIVLLIAGNLGGGFNGLVLMLVRLVTFAIACALLYQAYDAFRSAFSGTQPRGSAPNPDPTSMSARGAGVAWGIIALAMATMIFVAWFGGWGPWERFQGG
jgi:hypothetical protein